MTPSAADWHELRDADPELAAAVRGCFEAHPHHVLGTLRRDGSPRLSGTEVDIREQHVVLGMMPGSRKLADVRRDPRVELHSAPLEADLATGDAKLAGRLVAHDPPGEDPGTLFRLLITIASLVRVEGDELVLTVWRPGRGTTRHRRR